MQATQVQQMPNAQLPPTQMRDAGSGSAQNNANAQPGYGHQPGYRPTAMQQPVFPPPNAMNAGGYGQPSSQLPPSQMRSSAGGFAGMQQPQVQSQLGPNQMPVVSGDPRFVSPPPQLGRYATSPYYPPYRTVSYQLPQQSPPVLPIQTRSDLPDQPQSVPNTSGLPQFQSTVGVQPMRAQTVSYQAMQPGYCAPGIPSNGVPAYAPGAICATNFATEYGSPTLYA